MTQPIGYKIQSTVSKDPEPPKKTGVLEDFLEDLRHSLEKASTPCDIFCDKQWRAQLPSNQDREDTFIRSCIRDCRHFQDRLP